MGKITKSEFKVTITYSGDPKEFEKLFRKKPNVQDLKVELFSHESTKTPSQPNEKLRALNEIKRIINAILEPLPITYSLSGSTYTPHENHIDLYITEWREKPFRINSQVERAGTVFTFSLLFPVAVDAPYTAGQVEGNISDPESFEKIQEGLSALLDKAYTSSIALMSQDHYYAKLILNIE